MPSPTRIFRGLTVAELNALKTTALSRMGSGDFISLSGGGVNSTKAYSMTPKEILEEVNTELGVLYGNPRITRTTQDFSHLRVNNTTVS